MALIIEDGSIVAGANSYATVAEIQNYADLRNMSLPCSTGEIEVIAILAMDYLEAQCYQGELVEPNVQPLQWPRQYVYINGEEFPNNAIPSQLKNAQIELAIAQQSISILSDGTNPADNVKREKTDMIETEYYDGGKNSVFSSQRVKSYLRYLVAPTRLVRV